MPTLPQAAVIALQGTSGRIEPGTGSSSTAPAEERAPSPCRWQRPRRQKRPASTTASSRTSCDLLAATTCSTTPRRTTRIPATATTSSSIWSVSGRSSPSGGRSPRRPLCGGWRIGAGRVVGRHRGQTPVDGRPEDRRAHGAPQQRGPAHGGRYGRRRRVRTTIERTYPLNGVPEALRHLGEGRALGKLVIEVGSPPPP